MSFGSRSIPAPSKDDQMRFQQMRSGGCIVCRHYFQQWVIPEIHHLLHAGRRLGHQFSLALCSYHHRAVPREPYTSVKTMARAFGPSLACGSKLFRIRYGTDQELLDRQNRLIGRRLLQIEDFVKRPLPRLGVLVPEGS